MNNLVFGNFIINGHGACPDIDILALQLYLMKRREALSVISVVAGGAILLPPTLLTGCDRGPYTYELFTWGDTDLLNEIAEIIIPATPGVPGARAANVGEFVQLYVSDCYRLIDQKAFLEGFDKFKTDIQIQFGDDFLSLSTTQQSAILDVLEEESREFQKHITADEPQHFYTLLQTTIRFGYFTSEIGATKALRYVPVPGYQKGEIPYHGEKAWAL
jgi:hypothetical protein